MSKSQWNDIIARLSDDYWKYKGSYELPNGLKGGLLFYFWITEYCYISDFEIDRKKFKFIKIIFDTPLFDRITKDKSAKFVDKLSAVGGTMGLLTGFSIISGVEIFYFAAKMFVNLFNKKFSKWTFQIRNLLKR